jgi:hypothetical protein
MERNAIFSKRNHEVLSLRRNPRGLTTEMGEEPEDGREDDADDQAGDDGEIEGSVLAALNDVAGEAA